MSEGVKTIIYPVTDLAAAKRVFGALAGAEPALDQPYYVQYDVAGQQIGLDPNGQDKGMTGPVAYWTVTDIHDHVARLREAGATVQQDVTDVGGGGLIATLLDADGNPIGLRQG